MNESIITVETMHCDSLIAPQQPKNEIVNTIVPSTMTIIGTTSGLLFGKTSFMSSSLNNGIAPLTINAIPAT